MLDESNRIIYKPAQYEALQDFFNKKLADGSLHPAQFEDRVGEYALSIKSTEFLTKLQNIAALSKIRARDLQDIVDRVYVDIHALYGSIARAENTFNYKNKKIQQDLARVHDLYLKTKSDVGAVLDGLKHTEYDEIRRISFYDKVNYIVGDTPAVVVNDKLKLNGRTSNVLNEGKATVNISLNSDNFLAYGDPLAIIDGDKDSYWHATAISEAMVTSFLCEVIVGLPLAKSVSSVAILPACVQPQKVANIEYSINGVDYNTITGFDTSLATQNRDFVVIDFPQVSARFFRITLEQSNGIYRDRLVTSNSTDNDVDIIMARISHNVSQVDFTNYESNSEVIKQQLTKAIIAGAIIDPAEFNYISGYEYNFGIAELELNYTDYDADSIYCSRPHTNHKQAFQIELATSEIVTEGSSVEYAIDIGGGVSIPILPISANSEVKGELLHLSGDSLIGQPRFRINTSVGVVVKKNGIPLPPNAYAFNDMKVTILDSDDLDKTDHSAVFTIDYTARDGSAVNLLSARNSYSYTENFSETDPNGKVYLKLFPFIEYGVVNDLKNFYKDQDTYIYSGEPDTLLAYDIADPNTRLKVPYSAISSLIKILYLDGHSYGNTHLARRKYTPITVTVDGVRAINVTDYLGAGQSALSKNPIGQTNYSYIQDGNTITFGTSIYGKTIAVAYDVLAEHIALEVILRRNTVGDNSITPVIKDATLYIKCRNK